MIFPCVLYILWSSQIINRWARKQRPIQVKDLVSDISEADITGFRFSNTLFQLKKKESNLPLNSSYQAKLTSSFLVFLE